MFSELKIIFISGVSCGIGKFFCMYFCDLGYIVYGCLCFDIDFKYVNFNYLKGDVIFESDVKVFIGEICKKSGKLDVVVNNVGIVFMNYLLLVLFFIV